MVSESIVADRARRELDASSRLVDFYKIFFWGDNLWFINIYV